MSRLLVRGGRPLFGRAEAPPDKSILHRAALLGALGRGPCTFAPLGAGEDNRSTLRVLAALGVTVHVQGDRATVIGVDGPAGLRAPAGVRLDCGNSGTTMRLMAGILAASPGSRAVLDGDASLRRRPMKRLLPLTDMGARLVPEVEGAWTPPLRVEGAALVGRRFELAVASAQVKSALLLAGAFAAGRTTVVEPRLSRDHTERMLAARGVRLDRRVEPEGPHTVSIEGGQGGWDNVDEAIPPDVSGATFLLVAAAASGGRVEVSTGVNPTRTGALDVLADMGVPLHRAEAVESGGEPVATVVADGRGALRGVVVEGDRSLRAIDELPILAGAALFAEGVTIIRDAAELRAKESDRIEETARVLRAFGGQVEVHPTGLEITGGRPLQPARVDAAGDHRIGMMAAVVGLGVPGTTEVAGAEAIAVSFPGFAGALRGLGADVTEV